MLGRTLVSTLLALLLFPLGWDVARARSAAPEGEGKGKQEE